MLGIDPGLNVTGYAVVEPSSQGPHVVEAGVIRPSAHHEAMGQRLAYLYEAIEETLDNSRPERWRWNACTATSSIPAPPS